MSSISVNAVLLQDDEKKDMALATEKLSAKRVLLKSGLNAFKNNGKKVTEKKSVKPIRSLRERKYDNACNLTINLFLYLNDSFVSIAFVFTGLRTIWRKFISLRKE